MKNHRTFLFRLFKISNKIYSLINQIIFSILLSYLSLLIFLLNKLNTYNNNSTTYKHTKKKKQKKLNDQ
ncbi:hypothetical protein INR49_010791 [Caranx melampygus]|nr:hypothetical protein INR49_010791 [Caranx melampygus]